jgi:hypothetical protein
MKTLKQLCDEAIAVQDACNLSGVVHSFSQAMTALAELGVKDTEGRNRHPVAILYASKIASLTGCEGALAFSKAYDYCYCASADERAAV